MRSYGHWKWNGERFHPEDNHGFIYLIHSIITDQFYVGKKSFHRFKKSRRIGPSDWKEYTSSSEEVNRRIEKFGKEAFDFAILMVCQTKGQWSHAENNVMQKLDVLTRINQYEEPLFLNKQIGATRWIPKGYNGEHANNIVESFNNNLVQLILNPEFYE